MLVDKTQGIEQFAKPALVIAAWFIFLFGFFLTLLAITDFFSQKPEMNILWFIQISAFIAVFRFTIFYLKVKKGANNSLEKYTNLYTASQCF